MEPDRVEPDRVDADLAADEAALGRHARVLADGIEAALGPWVLRCVTTRAAEAGKAVDDTVVGAASVAAVACVRDVAPEVHTLLSTDIDAQRTSPLELLRAAVHHPTGVLRGLGVAPVTRDEFAARAFPEDIYDLAPATFADLDESLAEPGLVWGAAKAHVHLARRRAERHR